MVHSFAVIWSEHIVCQREHQIYNINKKLKSRLRLVGSLIGTSFYPYNSSNLFSEVAIRFASIRTAKWWKEEIHWLTLHRNGFDWWKLNGHRHRPLTPPPFWIWTTTACSKCTNIWIYWIGLPSQMCAVNWGARPRRILVARNSRISFSQPTSNIIFLHMNDSTGYS